MIFEDIESSKREEYNTSVSHPLQSFEWGEFRKKMGIKIIRKATIEKGRLKNGFTVSIHKVPKSKITIGYLPRGEMPNKNLIDELINLGKTENTSFFQLEPDSLASPNFKFEFINLKNSFHPLLTKYTFILDLTQTEEELLKNMHPKARYNIRVAQKHDVVISEDPDSFSEYLKLTEETTKRQGFYAHSSSYHKTMWETLKEENYDSNKLQAHLLKGEYKGKVLVTWIIFTFKDTLYYPYGASSSENREVMASTLMMWEAIKFGKNLGLKKFDMWGALSENADPSDPWFGFHQFKERFGPKLYEYAGSFDLIINPLSYRILSVGDKLRWAYLRARGAKLHTA